MLPSLAPERAKALTAALGRTHILVVGDAMLDKFIAGRVTRISPEAPVPVVMFDHESHRIGGAANVAHNVTALGGRATLVAVSGHDEAAATLAGACRDAGIAPALVGDTARPTTTKVRIVTERNQQVARVDYEMDAEITGDVEQRVVSALQQQASDASAIVISDYLKGCITARVFRERSACGAVLMTRGDQGMWLLGPDVEGSLPASAREVSDVTGAGDTVIATMALALAAGATLAEAARLANEAAGLAVAKFGPAVVTPAELLRALDASSAT